MRPLCAPYNGVHPCEDIVLDGISDEKDEGVDAYNEDGARGGRDVPVRR